MLFRSNYKERVKLPSRFKTRRYQKLYRVAGILGFGFLETDKEYFEDLRPSERAKLQKTLSDKDFSEAWEVDMLDETEDYSGEEDAEDISSL